MKKISKFKMLRWGMANHPGNPIYLIMIIMFSYAGFQNPTLPWYGGILVSAVILLPLYIVTSYSVGKANRNLIE